MVIFNCENPYWINGVARRCGQCPSCRRSQTLQWSLRGYHEQTTSYKNKITFFTLTYATKYLHINPLTEARSRTDCCGTLDFRDTQLFIKRLRKYLSKKYPDRKLRYMYCGEYGSLEKTFRPHYHFICFNFDNTEITPKLVKSLWPFGHSQVEKKLSSNFEIQYVTGYTRKKLSRHEDSYYFYEGNYRQRPKMLTSLGIGKEYALKNLDRLMERDYLLMSSKDKKLKVPIPRYYNKLAIKQEGITVKYYYQRDTDIINPPESILYDRKKYEEKKTYTSRKEYVTTYKIYPNPEGKYYNLQQDKQWKNLTYSIEALMKLTNIPDKELYDYASNLLEDYIKRQEQVKKDWQKAIEHDRLQKIFGGEIEKEYQPKPPSEPWKKKKCRWPYYLSMLEKIATQSSQVVNREIRRSKYGQRDRIE